MEKRLFIGMVMGTIVMVIDSQSHKFLTYLPVLWRSITTGVIVGFLRSFRSNHYHRFRHCYFRYDLSTESTICLELHSPKEK